MAQARAQLPRPVVADRLDLRDRPYNPDVTKAPPNAFNSLEHFVGSVAPHGVTSIIDLAKEDAARNKSGSAIAFVSGLFLALWAATGAMGALTKAVNRAYDRIETRPFWKQRLIALMLVIATRMRR